jgi:endonuclease/exonuclease/phosphatase (EEP) superfamily protein YafD
LARIVCIVVLAALFLLSALALVDLPWPAALAQHFLPQLMALNLVAALAFLVARKVRYAGAAAALGAVTFFPVATAPFVKPDGAPRGPDSLTIVWANASRTWQGVEDVLAFADREDADLVLLGAFPLDDDSPSGFAPAYPFQFDSGLYPPRAYNVSRMVALSRRDFLERALVPDRTGDNRLFMRLRLPLNDGTAINVLAAHPFPPESARYLADQIEFFEGMARAADAPFVIAGDLNATPWSSAYRGLLGRHVGDPKWAATWSGFSSGVLPQWLTGLHLDHFLISQDVRPSDYRIGPEIRSDHRPIVATVRLQD